MFAIKDLKLVCSKAELARIHEGKVLINTINAFSYNNALKDAVALADTLCKLLDDESLRHEMGEKGYQMFQEKFTKQQFERRMADCLKDRV